MSRIVSETIIPKQEGRAFHVMAGQVLRVTAHAGKQVADVTIVNPHDHRETLSVIYTAGLNGRSLRRAKKLYSAPPYRRVLMEVEHDPRGVHWLFGRCNRGLYESLGLNGDKNCHDNIVGALASTGIEEHEVPLDTFNLFMRVDVDADGTFSIQPPVVETGDYVDMRAAADVIVAISACPSEGELLGITNDGVAKPLKVEILQD